MPFSKKLEKIKEMLPLYSKRLVSDEKREEIENILSNEPALQKELNFWNGVKRGYDKIKNDFPEPSNNIYPKISSRIKVRRKYIWNIFSLNPKFSFGFIMFQFLVIIGLLFYILNLKYEYKTLSTAEIKAETAYAINVVFKEDVKEKEIRELLKKIDGRIIDGPSKTGLYVVGIKDREKKDRVLDILRKSGIVLLAEPAC
ncbi:hypothetical protein [Thermodesulfovibrio sp.]|uniref:hypothetical protein n=1 Tax=Thermodesulfovibrio sp. TaxID=2067987 RepID=UPI0030ABD65C